MGRMRLCPRGQGLIEDVLVDASRILSPTAGKKNDADSLKPHAAAVRTARLGAMFRSLFVLRGPPIILIINTVWSCISAPGLTWTPPTAYKWLSDRRCKNKESTNASQQERIFSSTYNVGTLRLHKLIFKHTSLFNLTRFIHTYIKCYSTLAWYIFVVAMNHLKWSKSHQCSLIHG